MYGKVESFAFPGDWLHSASWRWWWWQRYWCWNPLLLKMVICLAGKRLLDVHKRMNAGFAWWIESSHTIKRKKWPQNKGKRSGGGLVGSDYFGGFIEQGGYFWRDDNECTVLFVGDEFGLVGKKNVDGWRILCCRFLMLVASRLSRNSNQVRTTRYGIIIHFFSLSFCDFFTLFHI